MAFKPSRRKKHNTNPGLAKLNLNSMMDMFTIILLFLLKTYSAHGQLISPSKQLTLPESTITTHPETGLELIVSKQAIHVGNTTVLPMNNGVISGAFISDNGLVGPLLNRLKAMARRGENLEKDYGVQYSGDLTIQADKDIAYSEIVKILKTCSAAHFENIHLVVYRYDRE